MEKQQKDRTHKFHLQVKKTSRSSKVKKEKKTNRSSKVRNAAKLVVRLAG